MKILSEFPFVSIVIPCRNEEKHISSCLDSIIDNDYPKNFLEVLVIDGMSEDGSIDILKLYSRKYSFIKVINNPNKIIPSAFNYGIKNASGEIIIIMSAHAFYGKDYIRSGISTLLSNNVDIAGGIVINSLLINNLTERTIALITSHPFGVGNSPFRTSNKAGLADSVAFGFFHKNVFEKWGLFDENLVRNQDTEFWARVRRNGGKIFLNPDIKVFYYNQSKIKGLIKQASWTGLWNVFTFALHMNVMRPRHFIPAVFVLWFLISLFFIFYGLLFSNYFIFYVGILNLSLYFILDLIFSLSLIKGNLNIKGEFSIFPLSFIVFPLYHLAYGLGIWKGFAKLLTGDWKNYLGTDIGHPKK